MALGRMAVWFGASEDDVAQSIAPWSGAVIIVSFGHAVFYRLGMKDGEATLHHWFTW